MFTVAIHNGFVERHPCDYVVLPRVPVDAEERKPRLTEEDAQELFRMTEKFSWFNSVVRFLLLTGVRSGEAFGLRWVDVDFEFIASSPAWEYFEDWMLALKKECNRHDLLLTAAVATWYSDNISDKAMDCFDYVMVMAYDNDGDGENHSKYEYAVSEMQHYEKRGIAKKKLILGVPFYGYRYTASGQMDWNSGKSYRNIIANNAAAKNSDFADGYAYNGKETIRKKAELSKQYGGIMIWELSQDADGSDSLLKVINSVY